MACEMRQNKATKEWVIYATSRAHRPHDFSHGKKEAPALTDRDGECPFCPGNESSLSPLLLEMPAPGTDGWQARVIENKYPVLTPDGDDARRGYGIYLCMHGYGRHEVIIESPLHNKTMGTMSKGEVGVVVETYHRRYEKLKNDRANTTLILFRNHGPLAGTSLVHPHSQMIATAIVPLHIRRREEEARHYYDEYGRCVFCAIAEYEAGERSRVILENEAFIAFVPYAAEVPFEIWIMPKRHQADFGSTTGPDRAHLASILHESLARLHARLDDPDYNYVFNTAAQCRADEPHLHWFVQIQPRLTARAGFEIGSGMRINPSLPEENAEFLR
jgi:UDPglucose--hexose-1-phosphate uridylyltransferase